MRCQHIAYRLDHKQAIECPGLELRLDASSSTRTLVEIIFQIVRIEHMESLGLSYGSFMSCCLGLVMPSFVVAIQSIKV
jgi:hypothetical protein